MATFNVPNEASASYTDQAEIDSGDLKILAAGFNGSGVISGCLVTAQGSPDDTVAVSSGSYRISGATKTYAGGNVNVLSGSANPDGSTSSAANASYYRYDLIVVDSSSTIGVIHGTVPTPAWPDYAVNPVFPSFDAATQVVLAAILIPPTAASIPFISNSQIVAKNVAINVDGQHDMAHSITSATNHSAGWVAKGSLPVGTAATTSAMLAVGSNTNVLVADSTQTTGLKWTAGVAATQTADVTTSETTTSATYVDLATSGPAVTLAAPPSGIIMVIVGCLGVNSTTNAQGLMSYATSGGATVAASDTNAAWNKAATATNAETSEKTTVITGLTAGTSYTFTAKYRTGAGTHTFLNRRIIAIPL
jgi:hypothetical protein